MANYPRLMRWEEFAAQMRKHIVQYTKVQYGNPEGDEQIDHFTAQDCLTCIGRYYNRRNSEVRGPVERLRDLIKIAHYACEAYLKLRDSMGAEDVY